jgi:pimeloyl-ACP methyl ester carboxylesterase
MERFAQAVVDRARRERADELILVGHSTGGMLILDIAARCLRIDPDFAGYCGQTTVLTLGSTALKAGLHPAGGKFRERVGLLSRDERIGWTEIQCMTDVINFFRTNPADEMKLRTRPTFAYVREVQVRQMLLDETYRRIKMNPFRVHYQYIFGNSKRYWYDFFQICCGPTPVMLRAERDIFGPLPEADNP